MLTSLSIALFYVHEDAGTWSLLALAEHRGVIAVDDLDDFYNAAGAIAMYHDRFHCFLDTGAAVDLYCYVSFLLGSLATLSEAELPPGLARLVLAPDTAVSGHDRVVGLLHGEDQSRIVVEDLGDNLAISFLNPDGMAPQERLSPHFRGIEVTRSMWRAAAIEALGEYFRVAEERANDRPGERLNDLISLWKDGRHILGPAPPTEAKPLIP